ERGPIGPCSDCEPVFATAQAVIKHEGSCTSRGDADTKPPRCLRALDCAPRKVGDAVAPVGDRQALYGFLTKFPVCHWPRRVRAVSAQSIYLNVGPMYSQCRGVSTEIRGKIVR